MIPRKISTAGDGLALDGTLISACYHDHIPESVSRWQIACLPPTHALSKSSWYADAEAARRSWAQDDHTRDYGCQEIKSTLTPHTTAHVDDCFYRQLMGRLESTVI